MTTHRPRRIRGPAPAAALLFAATALGAGCAVPSATRIGLPLPGTYATFAYAALPGELYAEVIGNPFTAPQADVAAAGARAR